MATVAELTALYSNFMIAPRAGSGVCDVCFNLTRGFDRCYACAHGRAWLDLVAPISYSVAGGQLHHALAAYKRTAGAAARRLTVELAAVLWRHLALHEACIARTVCADGGFRWVTTVPSSDPGRDAAHPLRRIAGTLVEPTRSRHERLLVRSSSPLPDPPRAFQPDRYEPTRSLSGEPVLLIDDTWTTGASAQSAAYALKVAGSGPVAVIVIGRHLNRGWHENARRLDDLQEPFDWARCPYCGG